MDFMQTNLKARIDAYNEIQAMPFYVATRGEQDCCCATKAYLLEERLKKLGLQCRHILCWFKWESLALPQSVLAIEHESLPSHQFLEVFIPEKEIWVIVDPTWDPGLSDILPADPWDGLNPTRCAVPIERICTEEETAQIFKDCADPEDNKRYFESQGPFLRAVNEFLNSVREKRDIAA